MITDGILKGPAEPHQLSVPRGQFALVECLGEMSESVRNKEPLSFGSGLASGTLLPLMVTLDGEKLHWGHPKLVSGPFFRRVRKHPFSPGKDREGTLVFLAWIYIDEGQTLSVQGTQHEYKYTLFRKDAYLMQTLEKLEGRVQEGVAEEHRRWLAQFLKTETVVAVKATLRAEMEAEYATRIARLEERLTQLEGRR